MKQLKKDLRALKKDLKILSQKTEKMIKRIEQREKAGIEKKICFTCGKLKGPAEFHNSDKSRDGKMGRCKNVYQNIGNLMSKPIKKR